MIRFLFISSIFFQIAHLGVWQTYKPPTTGIADDYVGPFQEASLPEK
jgi:hypothetical protein